MKIGPIFYHFFGFLGIMIITSLVSQRQKRSSSLLLLMWCALSIQTAFQFRWLLSHPYWYIVIVWIIIACLLSFPLSFLLSFWMKSHSKKRYPLLSAFLVSFLVTYYEALFSAFSSGISFYSSSLMLASGSKYGIQLASLIGRHGISFFIFFSSCIGYLAWEKWRNSKNTPSFFILFSLWILLNAFPYLYGWHRIHTIDPSLHEEIISCDIAICHMEEEPDIFHRAQKQSPTDFVTGEWQKIITLLQPILHEKKSSCDLIVIPEGAVPYSGNSLLVDYSKIEKNSSHPERITSLELAHLLSQKSHSKFLIGMEGQELRPNRSSYNSAYFIGPMMQKRYDKQLLIPFGEYIPVEFLANLLGRYGVHGSFTAGKKTEVFSIPIGSYHILFSPFICYEETFSYYGIESRKKGANCIISLNNDAWFPASSLKQNHFDLARLHAVEIGIPFIRATNMGISGAIDKTGEKIFTYEGNSAQDNRLLRFSVPIEALPQETFYLKLYKDYLFETKLVLWSILFFGILFFWKKR